jgi:autonomous glycyl radical cofactor GrcA
MLFHGPECTCTQEDDKEEMLLDEACGSIEGLCVAMGYAEGPDEVLIETTDVEQDDIPPDVECVVRVRGRQIAKATRRTKTDSALACLRAVATLMLTDREEEVRRSFN